MSVQIRTSSNAPPNSHNMRSNPTSPAASSNISRFSIIRSLSPWETPSPYSAPSLRLTPSNNGSDTSDGVLFNHSGEPAMGFTATSRRLNRSFVQPLSSIIPPPTYAGNESGTYVLGAENVPIPYPPPGPFEAPFGAIDSGYNSRLITSRADSSGWERVGDLSDIQPSYSSFSGSELSWEISGTRNQEQPIAEASPRSETVPVSTGYILYTGNYPPRDWFMQRFFIDQPQSNYQRQLLGIPQGFGEPVERIQTPVGVSNPEFISDIGSFLGCNTASAIPPPKATLPPSSTSSRYSHPPPSVPDRLSNLPDAGPRGMKRRIEDDQCEVPKNTNIAGYSAVETDLLVSDDKTRGSTYGSRSVPLLQHRFKRTRRQGAPTVNFPEFSEFPLIDSTALSIGSFPGAQPEFSPAGPEEHHIITDSMEGYDCYTQQQQPEAEGFGQLATSSAESLPMYVHTTQPFEPEAVLPPQLNVNQHDFIPDQFHEQNHCPRDIAQETIAPPIIDPHWNTLEHHITSTGGEGLFESSGFQWHEKLSMDDTNGSDHDSLRVGYISSQSDYFASPSPNLGESGSPGLGPGGFYGPTPPPAHQAVQHSSYDPFTLGQNEDINPRHPVGFFSQDVAALLDETGGVPCRYDQCGEGGESTTQNNLQYGNSQKKRRRAFSNDRRIAVHGVRKMGACLRCQFLRESCDQGTPCGNCRKVDGKQKIWASMPCQRLRITDALLFRIGNSKFKQARAVPLPTPMWKSHTGKREIFLGRGLPIARKNWGLQSKYPELRIQCQEFIPREKDLLFEAWSENGREVKIDLPPFAACEPDDVSLAVRSYVRDTFDLFKRDMVTDEQKPLVKLVFEEALRYTEAHQCARETKKGTLDACMLKDALKIWILTRLAYEGFGILRGHEEFGLDLINNPNSPYDGTVPIPPILDHQLDTAGIEEMIRLKDNVLRALKAKIQKRRESQWYEVFLTIFVLLHNLEYVSRKQYSYMKRHESTRASSGERNIEFFKIEWMSAWEEAANMLIKYFQVPLKGAVPFTFNWEGSEDGKEGTGSDGAKMKRKAKGKRKIDPVAEAKERAGMDDAGVEFMKKVCAEVRANEHEFQRLRREGERREYASEMVWVSQLFLDV